MQRISVLFQEAICIIENLSGIMLNSETPTSLSLETRVSIQMLLELVGKRRISCLWKI
jgi:hypothetical protein